MCKFQKLRILIVCLGIDFSCFEYCFVFSIFQDALVSLWKHQRRRKVIKKYRPKPYKQIRENNDSSDSNSSTRIQQNADMSNSDSEDHQMFNIEFQSNSQVLNPDDHMQHSLETRQEPERESSEASKKSMNISQSSSDSDNPFDNSPDQLSDQYWMVPSIEGEMDLPSSASDTPMEEEPGHTIVSFHSVSGRIESFGTSILLTLRGEMD